MNGREETTVPVDMFREDGRLYCLFNKGEGFHDFLMIS